MEEQQRARRATIGVVSEVAGDERRVALAPESVKRLVARALPVLVEHDAGRAAFFTDDAYAAAGATMVADSTGVYARADLLVRVGEPAADDVARMARGAVVVAPLSPRTNIALLKLLEDAGVMGVALDAIPRITMAQAMDVVSSQANVAGYWAVVAAAARAPRYFPMLMTAAGTIPPAHVLVMGTGVAGLQAIGTARRLGAVVEATDVRPETREQVESLGARFLDTVGDDAFQRADVVITTANVPGKRAPVLVTKAALASMRAGSVVVDLAARLGGNVEMIGAAFDLDSERAHDEQREVTTDNGVLVLRPMNPASALPMHASLTFSRNVERLLEHLVVDGALSLRDDDEIQRACVVARAARGERGAA